MLFTKINDLRSEKNVKKRIFLMALAFVEKKEMYSAIIAIRTFLRIVMKLPYILSKLSCNVLMF